MANKNESGLKIALSLLLSIGVMFAACFVAARYGMWHGVIAGLGISITMAVSAVILAD